VIANASPVRIGILGPEEIQQANESRGCALWDTGYVAAVTTAGATPVPLSHNFSDRSWRELVADIDGLVWTGRSPNSVQPTSVEERFCNWCRKNRLPLLAIDDALLALNQVFGGTVFQDLPKERSEALQHRHPPERGLRHAIAITDGTRLCDIYGEGELVVNSEHRRAVNKVAKGFRVSAVALDGIIEAIEADNPAWFALGVQWRPASATASGLDIQVFRGLIYAAERRTQPSEKRSRVACISAA
jgi:putative glutamine amidotransferase